MPSYDKRLNKWKARLHLYPATDVHLGRFDTKQQAIEAEDEARLIYGVRKKTSNASCN